MTKVNLSKINTETGLNKRGRGAEWLNNYAEMCKHNYEVKIQQQQNNLMLQQQLKEDLTKILTGKN